MPKFQLTKLLRDSRGNILVICQFFIIILHFIKLEFLPKITIMSVSSRFGYFGYLIIIFASILMVLSIKDLGRNLSPFPKPISNGKLITSGIYSFIRHPMYYSLILISFGVFLIKFSLYYFSLSITLALVIKFKIILEEEYLNDKFKKYFLYKNKVRY